MTWRVGPVTWRVGRKVGRTIYFQVRGVPTDEDRLIGMMDTPELAAQAVEAYNAWERAQPLSTVYDAWGTGRR